MLSRFCPRIIVTRTAEQAQEVRRELKAGREFGVTAKGKSIDSTADEGGYMGRMNPEQLRAELRDGLRDTKPGGLSDVVRTPSGFAMLTVFSKAPNRSDLDKARIASMNSSKAVRQSIVVSGNGEAKRVFDQYSKPKGWERELGAPCEIRKKSMPDAIHSGRYGYRSFKVRLWRSRLAILAVPIPITVIDYRTISPLCRSNCADKRARILFCSP
jgi:hypothetical protein